MIEEADLPMKLLLYCPIILRKDCEDWENFEQNNILVALNVLFVSYGSEEIKLVYKSNYNKRKNQVILLMINDKVERYCYFAVKNLLQLKAVRIKV